MDWVLPSWSAHARSDFSDSDFVCWVNLQELVLSSAWRCERCRLSAVK